jgi:hypothetical protein
MELVILQKRVYGRQILYPINAAAKALAKIAGAETLTAATINTAVNELGATLIATSEGLPHEVVTLVRKSNGLSTVVS